MPAKPGSYLSKALTQTNRQPGGRSGDRAAGLRPLIPRGVYDDGFEPKADGEKLLRLQLEIQLRPIIT